MEGCVLTIPRYFPTRRQPHSSYSHLQKLSRGHQKVSQDTLPVDL